MTAPPCMYCGQPATVCDDPFWLCERCDAALVADMRQKRFPVAADPSPAAKVAAGDSPAPGPVPAATPNIPTPTGLLPFPPKVSENCAPVTDVPAGAPFSSIDGIDELVSAMEAAADRKPFFIAKKARTLSIVASSDTAAADNPISVSVAE